MKLNNLNLNKLLIFDAVVEHQGYGGAGEELSLTRSAISQAISALEESLAIPLFHRVGRRLVLTDAGRDLSSHVRKARDILQSGLTGLRPTNEAWTGELRIGTHTEFAKVHLLHAIVHLRREHPGLQIKFVFDAPSKMRLQLERDKLDLVFSIDPYRGSGLRSVRVLEEKMVLIAPRGVSLENPTLSELFQFPIIDYYINHQLFRRWLVFHYKRRPPRFQVSLFAASAELVLSMVEKRLGIGVVPDYLLKTLPADHVTIVRPREKQLTDHIWMSALSEKLASPLIKEFTTRIIA